MCDPADGQANSNENIPSLVEIAKLQPVEKRGQPEQEVLKTLDVICLDTEGVIVKLSIVPPGHYVMKGREDISNIIPEGNDSGQ